MTYQPSELSLFQIRFLGSLKELLKTERIEVASESLKGQADKYVRIVFAHRGSTFDLFVYRDEVGFFVNGVWRILESQDYRGPDDLHREAIARLTAEFGSLGT